MYVHVCFCFSFIFLVTRTKQQWLDTHKLEIQTAEPGCRGSTVRGLVLAGSPMAGWAQGTGKRQHPAVTLADSGWQQQATSLSLHLLVWTLGSEKSVTQSYYQVVLYKECFIGY